MFNQEICLNNITDGKSLNGISQQLNLQNAEEVTPTYKSVVNGFKILEDKDRVNGDNPNQNQTNLTSQNQSLESSVSNSEENKEPSSNKTVRK